MTDVNWAGTHAYRAERIHRPATTEQLQEIVAASSRVRVLGSRHSFTDPGGGWSGIASTG